MFGENTDLYEADSFASGTQTQRSVDTTGVSMHGMDETRLEQRGLPKWTLMKQEDEKKHKGEGEEKSASYEDEAQAQAKSERIQALLRKKTGKSRPIQAKPQEKLPTSPSWNQRVSPQLTPSNGGLLNLQSENMPWQGTPRNIRRDKSAEVRKAQTARMALEGRQWKPRLGNRPDRDKVASVPQTPSPAPVPRSDFIDDIRHEDTLHANPRVAAREQNVRLAKGLLQESIQALQEDERQEQQIARRAALEQDMSFAEECQNMLLGHPGASPSRFAAIPTSHSFKASPVPAMATGAAAALARGTGVSQRPYRGGMIPLVADSAEAKPHLPEWAAWWDPQFQAPVPQETELDQRVKSIKSNTKNANKGCFGSKASSKGAEARRQERLIESIKL